MVIAVAGNIGTGKTTLVRRLSDQLEFTAEYEAARNNPYLSLFYKDMQRWAFPLQVYFLGCRFKQGLKLKEQQSGVVLDRTIYEDAEIFAKNLYESEILSEIDYKNYLNLYQSMQGLTPTPDLLVFLEGSPELLKERILERSRLERSYEKDIPLTYLKRLNKYYSAWVSKYTYSPKISINIDQIDLAKNEHFETLLEKIQNLKKCVT